MGGIAHHQGALWRHTKFTHQLVQHQRVGLTRGFIGCTRGVKQALQLHGIQSLGQTFAAFAGSDRQHMLAFTQSMEHGQDAVEQADVVDMLLVMETVALAEQGVFLFWHIGCGVSQSRHERHTDHISGCRVTRFGATHILHRRLDATRDDLRRIKQSAIPIEGDQIKLPGLWRGAHRGTGGCTESINCCRAAGSGALTVTGRALTGC